MTSWYGCAITGLPDRGKPGKPSGRAWPRVPGGRMVRRFAEDLYRERVALPTPVRLRIWTASIVAGALALLAAAGLGLTQLRGEVRAISTESAPLAATASDLYFALSDLEA